MVKRKTAIKIRKTHRYLGIFLGLQFILWTSSGLYFSWTDIDEIHGDQFKNENFEPQLFNDLISLNELKPAIKVGIIELRDIDDTPYYWINEKALYNAKTGALKTNISENEALAVAKKNMSTEMIVANIALITETDSHHEYREKLLPAYVITYENPEAVKAYVSKIDGAFQTVRHRSWRWFDFLWMTHTMDYEGRDDFNTIILRAFSILGLITVFSGFLLWFTSSPTIRKISTSKKNYK